MPGHAALDSRLTWEHCSQGPATRDNRHVNTSSFVVTGSRDKTIRIWDCQTGQCLKTLTGHDNWIRALVFHPTGKFLLSASDDKTIRIWDLTTGRCTKTIEAHNHFVTCMAWGRTTVPGQQQNGSEGKSDSQAAGSKRLVNVLATGSVDQVRYPPSAGETATHHVHTLTHCTIQTLKIWLP